MQNITRQPPHICEPGTPYTCAGCAWGAGHATGVQEERQRAQKERERAQKEGPGVNSWFEVGPLKGARRGHWWSGRRRG